MFTYGSFNFVSFFCELTYCRAVHIIISVFVWSVGRDTMMLFTETRVAATWIYVPSLSALIGLDESAPGAA